jgi:hypothetical protein
MITQSTSAEHNSARRPRLVVVDDRIVPRLFRYVILAAPLPPRAEPDSPQVGSGVLWAAKLSDISSGTVTRVTDRPLHPLPPERSRLRTAALVVLIWSAAALAALVFASDTKIGPVLIKFSRGHGVHLGDALMFVLAIATAGSMTWLLVRRRPSI